MINETKGDVAEFLNDFKNRNPNKTIVLIHQCNCFNTLGRARGFAGVLDKMFPQIVVADQATTKGDGNKLGQYSKAKIDDNLWIFNAYGQYYYGMSPDVMYTDYDALQNSLGLIKTLVDLYIPNPVFLMPKFIGADRANGNHNKIMKDIIKPLFEESETYLIYN